MTTHDHFFDLARGFLGLSDADMRMMQQSTTSNFPPVDIIDTSDDSTTRLRIDMAVAGWEQENITIEVDNRVLTITGRYPLDSRPAEVAIIARGIARRNFKRQFKLAEYYEVESAELKNGILTIDVVKHVPEHAKPRAIAITHQP